MKQNISIIEQLYNHYMENPTASNEQACDALKLDSQTLRTYKSRLKRRGLIGVKQDGSIEMLRPYREIQSEQRGFKYEVYEEMVETYLDDFRKQGTFADRLAVGREIRLLLERI